MRVCDITRKEATLRLWFTAIRHAQYKSCSGKGVLYSSKHGIVGEVSQLAGCPRVMAKQKGIATRTAFSCTPTTVLEVLISATSRTLSCGPKPARSVLCASRSTGSPRHSSCPAHLSHAYRHVRPSIPFQRPPARQNQYRVPEHWRAPQKRWQCTPNS